MFIINKMEYKPRNRHALHYSKLSSRRCVTVNPNEYEPIESNPIGNIDISIEPDAPQIQPIYGQGPLQNIDISNEPDAPQIMTTYRGQVVNRNGRVQEIAYPTYQQTDLYMTMYNQMAVYNQNMNKQARVYEELLNSGMGPY